MAMANLVTSNPKVLMGKPVIAGTRIPVELILEKLAAGETVEQILQLTRASPRKEFGRPLRLPRKPYGLTWSIRYKRRQNEISGR